MKFPRNFVFFFVSAFLVFPQFAFAVPQMTASVRYDIDTWNLTYNDMKKIFSGKEENVLGYAPGLIRQMSQKDKDNALNAGNVIKTSFSAVKLEDPLRDPFDEVRIEYQRDFAEPKTNVIFVKQRRGQYVPLQKDVGDSFRNVTAASASEYSTTSTRFEMPISVEVADSSCLFYIPNALIEAKVATKTEKSADVNVFLLKADVANAKIFKYPRRRDRLNAGTETTWQEFQQSYGARYSDGSYPHTPNPWYFVVAVAEKSMNISFSMPKLNLSPWAKNTDGYFAAL